jgi:hypothetical protein
MLSRRRLSNRPPQVNGLAQICQTAPEALAIGNEDPSSAQPPGHLLLVPLEITTELAMGYEQIFVWKTR